MVLGNILNKNGHQKKGERHAEMKSGPLFPMNIHQKEVYHNLPSSFAFDKEHPSRDRSHTMSFVKSSKEECCN